jgi:hypothetical protein
MAICEECGRAFAAKRADAKLCSPKCRKVRFLARKGGAETAGTDNGMSDIPMAVERIIQPSDRRPPDDGVRFIDRWGYIHREPAGLRSQLPGRRSERWL